MTDEKKTNHNEDVQEAITTPVTDKPSETETKNMVDKRSRNLSTVAIVIAVLFSGGLFYTGQQKSEQQQSELSNLKQQLASLKGSVNSRIATAQQQTLTQTKTINQKAMVLLEQQDKSIVSLQLALSDMKGRRPNDWLLAEADYLVKLAGRKLWLEHDIVSATVLMESADQRIAALNDASLVPLRQAMTNDITALKTLPLIDRDGLVLQLTSLQKMVDELPLANAILPEAAKEVKAVVSEDINQWQDNLMTSLQDFAGHFVTYRVRDGNVIPLLSPQQHFYLQENIRGKLESAIRSVYREQSDVYQTSLQSAKQWANQFYKQDDAKVTSFIATLDKLSTQNIEIKYPVSLTTQALLSDYISERLRRNIVTLGTESIQEGASK
ncbi:MAG: uroporphyrinogen-III C-methyltransferase [Aliivibrio sp.]|uniref:uroporphyrinogen-III C-methyltransferase n=1 Tax=Aliivibrio sp. TaxID=1872443 RepID=UPI001A5D9C15|nr:uroporphyrinogen-III C-methyltransferase [Aliivibrio sp.]